MKNQFILLLILISASSCSVFRPGTTSTDHASGNAYSSGSSSGKTSQPNFISGISTSDNNSINTRERLVTISSSAKTSENTDSREKFSNLQFKYAILTNTPVEQLTNQKLLDFMDEWYGVPYHYGGTGKEGIDCSAFTSLMMSDVYTVNDLPRISRDQFKESQRIPKTNLKEGDLVFFHTLGKGHAVTHVGVYLYNNRFIHASVAGVQISDLGEGYYARHFVGAGRVIRDSGGN